MAIIGTQINKAVQLLKNGNLVAIPTETVYGLAANALDKKAVAQIFQVKNRPSFDPLIVHVSSLAVADEYVTEINTDAQKLARAFSPGPITLILKKKGIISDLVTSGHPTVAIRIPRHPLTQILLESLDFPLAAPSANPFGFVSPTTAQHVMQQLGNSIPYIIDGGPATVGVESTIVDVSQKTPKILRLGGLALEEIEDVLGKKIAYIKKSSSNPAAPGMLVSHYSPGCPLVLGKLNKSLLENATVATGVLSFGKTKFYNKNIVEFNLSKSADLIEAAQNLFTALRSFADKKVSVIYAQKLPERELGRAINDRLTRAATQIID